MRLAAQGYPHRRLQRRRATASTRCSRSWSSGCSTLLETRGARPTKRPGGDGASSTALRPARRRRPKVDGAAERAPRRRSSTQLADAVQARQEHRAAELKDAAADWTWPTCGALAERAGRRRRCSTALDRVAAQIDQAAVGSDSRSEAVDAHCLDSAGGRPVLRRRAVVMAGPGAADARGCRCCASSATRCRGSAIHRCSPSTSSLHAMPRLPDQRVTEPRNALQ